MIEFVEDEEDDEWLLFPLIIGNVRRHDISRVDKIEMFSKIVR